MGSHGGTEVIRRAKARRGESCTKAQHSKIEDDDDYDNKQNTNKTGHGQSH
jgi:hypothetical protein